MATITTFIRDSIIKRLLFHFPSLYGWYKKRQFMPRLLEDAKIKFAQLNPEDMPPGASFEDYCDAMKKHLVSFREYYYSFQFWNKTEEERDKYISREATHNIIFRLLLHPGYDNITVLWSKHKFLEAMSRLGFNRRKWLYSPDSTREQMSELLHNCDCIIKDNASTWGIGVSKVHKDNEEEIAAALDRCEANQIVIEECITSCHELEQFHPQSCNTLRVVTITYNDKSIVYKAGFRMGRGGAVVDNTKFGGLYVEIDVNTGNIPGEAIDYTGKTHKVHPDTGVQITGYTIPRWGSIMEQCNNAAKALHATIVIGWDVCLMEDGHVEFIEANHMPDFSGDKYRLLNTIKEMTGISYKI